MGIVRTIFTHILVRNLLAVLAIAILAACAPHRPPMFWTNPTHPAADSTRDLYDCGVTARQVLAEKYEDAAVREAYQERETDACMASRGWQHVSGWRSTMIVKPGTDTIHFHTVTPPDTAH